MPIESRQAHELPEDYLNEKGPDLFEDAITRLEENKEFRGAVTAAFLSPDPRGREIEFEHNGSQYSVLLTNTDTHKFIKFECSDAESNEVVSILVDYDNKSEGTQGHIGEVALVYTIKYASDGAEGTSLNTPDAVINITRFLRKLSF